MPSLIAEALLANRITASSVWWRRLLLALNLPPPVLLILTHGTQPWIWIYAFVVHHFLLVGLLFPKSKWLGPILNKLPTKEKMVWLTIDDGPSDDTVILAKMLEEQGVSATFFLIGRKLSAHPEAVAALQRHGHTVANHTQTHDLAWFWLYPPWKVVREVDDFQSAASQMNAPLLPVFRCPAGLKNPFLHTVLGDRGLTLAGWSLRAYDGIRCDRHKSIPRMLDQLHPGAILLVHEGKKDAAGTPASVEFIRQLVVAVQAEGYRFAS